MSCVLPITVSEVSVGSSFLHFMKLNLSLESVCQKALGRDFTGGPVVKNLPDNAGDVGSIPGPGRSHIPQSNQVHLAQLLKPKSCS